VLVAAVCVRLGVWQLDRLEQRRARNDAAAAHLAQRPIALDADAVRSLRIDPDPFRFRRVTAVGRFDFDRELIVVGRSDNGRPGVHVATPLLVDDSVAVLVERGWLPAADSRTYDSTQAREPAQSTVAGVLLQAPARPMALSGEPIWPLHVVSSDPTSVALRFPYAVLPLVLRRTSTPDGTALHIIPLPEATEGPHLSYALQWFGFATIALVGSTILVFRRTRPSGVGGPPPAT
jgi:surfeit locus 1 family protein